MSKSGGIGLVPMVLLGFALYTLIFDEDKKDTESKEETEVQITIQNTKEELKKDAKQLIENGKKLLDSVLQEQEKAKEEISKTKTEGAEEELKKDEEIKDPKKTEQEPTPEKPKKPKLKKL